MFSLLLTVLRILLKVLKTILKWPQFLKEGCQEIKCHIKKDNARSVWYLGLFYCIELYNYQVPNILLSVPTPGTQPEALTNAGALIINYHHKDIWFFYLHGGLFLGMIFFSGWIWRSPQKIGPLLKRSLWFHFIGVLFTTAAIFLLKSDIAIDPFWKCQIVGLGRAVFGFGFAAGLGLAVTVIVEDLPRSTRTWAATLVGIIGFSGPVLADLFEEILPANYGWILLILGVGASVILLIIEPPKLSDLRKYDGISQPYSNIKQMLIDGETLKLLGACFLMGVSVQFFSDMVSWLPRISGYWYNDCAHGFRYFGFLIGTLFAGVLSKFLHHRRKVLFGFILMQVFVVGLVSFAQYSFIDNGADKQPGNFFFTSFVYFTMGLVCGHWMIAVIQIAEQFSIQERPFMAIIMPNLYRLATVVVVWLNYYYMTNEIHGDQTIAAVGWIGKYPGVLMAFWLASVVASMAASILLNDNFEANPFHAAYMNKFRYSSKKLLDISGDAIRKKLIKEISEKIWTSRDELPFLKIANKCLFEHFKDSKQLNGHFVLSTIFFAEEERKVLEFAGFGEKNDQYDKQTCLRYSIGANTDENFSPVNHHVSVHQLIRHKSAASLAGWMTDHTELAGVLIYFRGWREQVNKEHLEFFRTFDLSKIKISQEDVQSFSDALQPSASIDRRAILLENLFEKYGSSFDKEFEVLLYDKPENRKKDDPIVQQLEAGIKKTLLMHRLDAENYGAGNYYTYYVNPHYGHENHYRIALVLKTVIPLQKDDLNQIGDLLSFLILKRSTKIHQYNSEQFFQDEDHSTRKMLDRVREELDEFLKWASRTKTSIQKDLPINEDKLETIRASLSDARDSVKRMYDLRMMNMALVRYFHGADLQQLKDRGLPEPRAVDLYLLLNSIIKQFKDLKVTNQVQAHVKINVIETALFIILYELLHNATSKMSKKNPFISIHWYRIAGKPNFHELHIKNNLEKPLSEDEQQAL
ncbi:MAG: MFS transporter, partial [Saprospiraceae bacterium]|nr:MFS transporter [Saprospiraceae bacterium]